MKILPARIGPTVCELLGPTEQVRISFRLASTHPKLDDTVLTTNAKQVERGNDSMPGFDILRFYERSVHSLVGC